MRASNETLTLIRSYARLTRPVSATPHPVRINSYERLRLLAVIYRPFPLILVTRISLVALSRRGATMDALDVFRLTPDGSVIWIGSADSLRTALKVIKALKVKPSDAFLIHDSKRNDTLTVRANKLPPS